MTVSAPYRLLGGFRLLLAALVLVQHTLVPLAPLPLAAALGPLEAGTVAVLIFFALSGFIVTEAAVRFYDARPVAFIANRMLRIYPSYLAALAVTLAAAAWLTARGHESTVALHISGIPAFTADEAVVNALAALPGGRSILAAAGTLPIIDIAWALRVELAFYGVLAACLAVARWSGRAPSSTFLAAGLVALAAWLAAGGWRGGGGMLAYAPHFVFGAALFFCLEARTAAGRRLAGLLAASALVAALASVVWRPLTADMPFARDAAAQLGLYLALVVVWLLLLAVRPEQVSPRTADADRWAGEATYPLYLLHTTTAMTAAVLVPERGWLALALAFLLSLAAAALATATYEKLIGRARAQVRGFDVAARSA